MRSMSIEVNTEHVARQLAGLLWASGRSTANGYSHESEADAHEND